MEDDWDLHAVVRGCSAVTTTTSPSLTSIPATTATAITGSSSTTNTPSFAVSDFYASSNSIPFSFGRDPVNHLFSLQDPFEATSSSEELHELYKPFFFKSQPQPSLLLPPPPPPSPSPQPPPQLLASPTTTFSPLSPLSSLSSSKVQTHKKQHSHLHKQSHAGSVSTPRSKRRKNQLKKVCQVPAESLSSDIWAWRKYGQKPIKGSPYPRGYYRCSSSKGCMARKQVERNRSDPGMFIVTYTAEHNHPAPTHRNSLAGSTRQKPIPAQPVEACEPNKIEPKQPACSASPSGEDEVLAQSTISESKEEKEDLVEDEEDDDLGISDMIVNDDFFVGFAELDSPHSDDCFSDQFPANFGLPWLFNNAATAAGGI